MKLYAWSIVVGLLVGVIYSLLRIRSPAPPLVALVGLLGILLGQQAIPLAKHLLAGNSLPGAWRLAASSDHIFGLLPGRHTGRTDVPSQRREGVSQ
jgi:XapX domain-containing protein